MVILKEHHLKRLALSLLFLAVAAIQPIIAKADLNGIEACQNRCLDRSKCDEIGNGLCCQWNIDVGQCISRIGQEKCPGTATMLLPPHELSIACHPTSSSTMTLVESTSRIILDIEAEVESTPSSLPTTAGCGKYKETSWFDWYLCQGHTVAQLTALLINWKVSSGLSILGSGYVIQDVLRDPKKRKESTYHRIMIGLSCSDIIFSFFFGFLGSWAMPKGTQLFAVGTKFTCQISGFFVSICSATPLFNCSLATFYLLKLKFSWNNRKVRAIEKWLLILPCVVGIIVAIMSTTISDFGPWGHTCM